MKAFTQEVNMRFEIVQGGEQPSSHLGLALAGAILEKTSIQKQVDTHRQAMALYHSSFAPSKSSLCQVGKA